MSMKIINLSQGMETKVDDSDFELFKNFKWCAHWNRNSSAFTAVRTDRRIGRVRTILLHREITGAKRGEIVDHINHDALDNRRINLRICSNAENQMNRRQRQKNSKSGILGVCLHKPSQRWAAQITVYGKQIHLGLFASKELAKQARITAEINYYGQFASSRGQ